MKTYLPSIRGPLARARYTALHLITAAGLLLGGLIATSSADILYVTQIVGNIEKITSNGTGTVFAGSNVSDPNAIAFDGAGNLYIANYGTLNIVKFTPSGSASVFAVTADSPIGLAFDSAGNLFCSLNNNVIMKYDSSGNGSVFATTGLSTPVALAFDAAGNLYAANRGDSTIEKFATDGTPSLFAGPVLSDLFALAFDTQGNLYAAYASPNTIMKFNSAGTPSFFAGTGLSYPNGMAFDSAGNLFVANLGDDTIHKFSSTGADLGAAFTGANGVQGPRFIAFTDDAGRPLPPANQGSTTTTANARKVAVQGALFALLPSGEKDTDKRLQKAIDSLAKSLDPTLWVDGNHLATKAGQKVFEGEKQAVQSLSEIYNGKKTPAGVIDPALDAINKLVTIDIDLATTAMADAMTAGGDGKKLAEATKELAKAAAADQAGKVDEAIEHAKQAWQKAQDSLKN